jgi:hypothetical protein
LVTIEKIDYKGWPNSYRITNGEVEAVITSDIGPRVMRYGFLGGQNFFKEFEEGLGKSGEPVWQLRGGHRLWVAPEDRVRTYAPDNGPVQIEIRGPVLTATQPVEDLTGLEKQLTLEMASTGTEVVVQHRLRNAGAQPCQAAPWALSMMAPGGAGIHGFPPRGQHPAMLSPSNPLVMWHFTNLADPRWRLLEKFLVLLHDPNHAAPQKLGSFHPFTWAAYLLNGDLFLKRCTAPGEPSQYPDLGCSFEIFANAEMLELETLGPVRTLAPGESLIHTERWTLHRGVRIDRWTDEELDRVLAPLIAALQ